GPPRSASAPTFRARRLEPEETMADLYDIGEKPPLGEVPARMHAYLVRQNRFGQPRDAWKRETIPTPTIGPDEVLIYVMASGINYNNVWAALGQPLDVIAERQRLGEPEDFPTGGLGSMALEITRAQGGRAVAVVSDEAKRKFCTEHGAAGVINRTQFDHWGPMPDTRDGKAYGNWANGARAFGKAIWDGLGEKTNPRIVFEHPGES